MEFVELENGTILEIRASDSERAILQEILDDADPDDGDILGRSDTEADFLEVPLANSEYGWIDPADTGDLTSAPMLARLDEDGEVSHRWAFMDYQVASLLEELLEHGKVQLVGGSLTESESD